MKWLINVVLLIILFLLLFACSKDNSTNPATMITLEQAEQILLTEVLNDTISECIRVYEFENVLEKDFIINSWNNQYTIDQDCWFFFIDDMFHANWAHPCRYVYIYHENESGENLEVINEMSPPDIDNLVEVTF